MAKILITGANGFVGSHVLQTFMSMQHDDLEIVAACRDPKKLLPDYKGEVRVGDLRDADYMDRLLVNIDIVCHTAGWSSFVKDKGESTELYLEPTLELINHSIEWRVSRFVNLSSIAVSQPAQRQNAHLAGQPKKYWPMINCLIAIEDYMKAHSEVRCSMVNLRAGIYSGERMNIGLLPILIDRLPRHLITYPNGAYGHFPLVDGKDIGQAFARAALAPELQAYESINITGPDLPGTADVMAFLRQQLDADKTTLGLPARISFVYSWLQEQLNTHKDQVIYSRNLSHMICNSLINNDIANEKLGYDPEINWQASLHKLLDDTNKQHSHPALSAPYKPLNLTQ